MLLHYKFMYVYQVTPSLACIGIFLGGAPTSICLFSICSFITHHISGTIHHLIIVFGTLQVFFSFFLILIFWAVRGVKGQKLALQTKT